jgi:hypothetical protein
MLFTAGPNTMPDMASNGIRRKDTTKGPPLRILSLDGGGVRGYSMLIILQELMHRTFVEINGRAPKRHELPKPCEHFDLIVGTGTGGLILNSLTRLVYHTHTHLTHLTPNPLGIPSSTLPTQHPHTVNMPSISRSNTGDSTASTSSIGDNRGIRFSIKTGGKSWDCTLQDRSTYERTKAARTTSTDSVETNTSTTTQKST